MNVKCIVVDNIILTLRLSVRVIFLLFSFLLDKIFEKKIDYSSSSKTAADGETNSSIMNDDELVQKKGDDCWRTTEYNHFCELGGKLRGELYTLIIRVYIAILNIIN
jgi:hypothetical protein